MKFKAHADVVVVKVDQGDEKTSTGIYIPNEAVKMPNTGEIVTIGEGKIAPMNGQLIPTTFKKGNRIMFIEGAGAKVTLDDQDYRIMKESDILGSWK